MSESYQCDYCTEDGHCKKFLRKEVASWCIVGSYEDEKPSNGDRIRAMTIPGMTDEGLASFIALNELKNYPQRDITEELDKSYNKWLDWLRKESIE